MTLFQVFQSRRNLAGQGLPVGLRGGVGGLGLGGFLLDVQELADDQVASVGGARGLGGHRRDGRVDVAALEVAAIAVYLAAAAQLGEDLARQVGEVFLRAVVGAVGVGELLQTGEFLDAEQVGGTHHGVDEAVELLVRRVGDVPDVGDVDEPCRLLEEVLVQPIEGVLLAVLRHGGVFDEVGLLDAVVRDEPATDVGGDVAEVAVELADDGFVHAADMGVHVGFLIVPGRDLREDALEVEDAIGAGRHGVVAEVLGQRARVGVTALAAEPQARVGGQALDNDLVPVEVVFLGGLEVGGLVAELDGPLVIVADARIEAGLGNAVLGLGHVVEAGVVHDGDGVAVGFDPGLVAELLDRGLAAGAHVVAQAEGVTDLVGGDEADEVAHQLFVILDLAGARVHGAGLDLVPVVHQGHDVVVPAHVALDDLAGARVVDVGAVGVGDRGGQVADHAEAGVLEAHAQLFGILRPLLGVDGVLPAGLLEGDVPVIDTGDEVLAPLLGGGGVDVVDDRLDGLHKLAALLALDVLGTGLEPVAGDEADALDALLVVGELAVASGEITHARIEPALLHRFLGEQDDGGVEHHGHGAVLGAGGQGAARLARACARRAGRRVVGVGLGDRHLGVDRIGADAVDEGGVSLEGAEVAGALGARIQGEHLQVAFEQAVDLDARAARGALLRLEGCEDRVLGADLDGLVDDLVLGGPDIDDVGAEEEVAVGGFLPVDHRLVDLFAAVRAGAGGLGGVARHGEHPAAEHRVGDVEIPVLLVLADAEETFGDLEFNGGFRLLFVCSSVLGGCGRAARLRSRHAAHGKKCRSNSCEFFLHD